MGFILRLIVLIIILVFAYWLIAPYALAPDTPGWAEINRIMPDSFRRFACQEWHKQQAGVPVKSCEAF